MTDKIEVLEHQVVETVQTACTAVSETVVTVREIVHDSLQMARDSVHGAAETVKGVFDLRLHVARRPWTMFAGATAAGYLGGRLLRGGNGREAAVTRTTTGPNMSRAGAGEGRAAAAEVATNETDTAPFSDADNSTWHSNLRDMFQAETSELKRLAMRTLLGVVRDILANSAPKPMKRQLEGIVNGSTIKLGRQPHERQIRPERSGTEGMDDNEIPDAHESPKLSGSPAFGPP
jgi:hypothetical protein